MGTTKRIAILGAGSWGTAVAIHLARLHHQVHLWGRDAAQMQQMQIERNNKRYLSSIVFPDNLVAVADFSQAVTGISEVIIAVPSHAFRETVIKLKPYLSSIHTLLWLTKGLDPTTHQLLHQVAQEILSENIVIGILSGPTFAKEVALQLPTAMTLASNRPDMRDVLVQLFHSPTFRVYFSQDIIGVQLGGAVKNVLAIAVGIADGLQCGANAQAALMTRGLAEMMRLGQAFGAHAETLMGLSGLGDLILTCTNNQSRNRRFGLAIGKGTAREQAEKEIGQVVEGISAAAEVYHVAQQHQVEMPITTQIYQVLYHKLSPQQALHNLLMREPKDE
jgi:glycerol-3-phosphate dehydrogenase (NAD(P)+)